MDNSLPYSDSAPKKLPKRQSSFSWQIEVGVRYCQFAMAKQLEELTALVYTFLLVLYI